MPGNTPSIKSEKSSKANEIPKDTLAPHMQASTPRELPTFKSVLRPTVKQKTTRPLIPPRAIPDPSKALKNLSLGSSKTESVFQVGGKFSNSAKLADTSLPDEELKSFGSSSPLKAFSTQPVHSKPRFKQVTREDRRKNAVKFPGQKSDLEKLMDDNYDGTEADDVDTKNLANTQLEIPGLIPMLLPHQCYGVRFMSSREAGRKHVRGGLLADDMGLGKTIQSIALILYRPPKSDSVIKTTLVVVPLAVMDQWYDEMKAMAPKLKVRTHQGQDRTADANVLHEYDVVVTTYNVVSMEFKNNGPLFQRPWYRIIADEAHIIRNPVTSSFKAMAALDSDGRRWALTGTPIHNNIMDLYSLFAFIRVPKYNSINEFKKVIDQSSSTDFELLRKELKVIMLRRTQRVIAKSLPAIKKIREPVTLSDTEMNIYLNNKESFRLNMSINLVTKMRQACNGLLSNYSTPLTEKETDKAQLKQSQGTKNALETLEDDESDVLANLLGKMSLAKSTDNASDDKKDTFLFHENSKVQSIRKILMEDKTRQTVIFSTFLTMVHTITPMLDHEGITYALYHGGLKAQERKQILARFKDSKAGLTVLLCTLQTAAVGLNLTSASQVILVEPWWNPQIVDQAIKRVHRLGQKNEVRCVELFAKDVMEERMMELQDKKRELARHLLEGSDKLTDEDKSYLWFGDEDKADGKHHISADKKIEREPTDYRKLKFSKRPTNNDDAKSQIENTASDKVNTHEVDGHKIDDLKDEKYKDSKELKTNSLKQDTDNKIEIKSPKVEPSQLNAIPSIRKHIKFTD